MKRTDNKPSLQMLRKAADSFDSDRRDQIRFSLFTFDFERAITLLAVELRILPLPSVEFALIAMEMVQTRNNELLVELAKFAVETPELQDALFMAVEYAKHEVDEEVMKEYCFSLIDGELVRLPQEYAKGVSL